MNRHLARALGAMALGTLLLQPVTAMADPPAHARNEHSAKHRGQGWSQSRGGDHDRHDDRGDDRRHDERYDDHRHYGDRHHDGRRAADHHHRYWRAQPYYYPRHGHVVDRLPPHPHVVHHHGDRYYYGGGAWYRPYGPRFVVVAPPIGLVVSFLPDFHTTVYFGGIPYYDAGPVYYVWSPRLRGYVVTEFPFG